MDFKLANIFNSLKRITIAVITIITLFFTVSYLTGLFNTTELNRYVLTNGNKVIIFQEMRHIAQGQFYKSVDKDIKDRKKEGYQYLYEGIYAFNNERNMYKNKKIEYTEFKLMEQPSILGGVDSTDINADLNYFDITNRIQKKVNITNKKIQETNKNSFIKKAKIESKNVGFNKMVQESATLDIVDYTEKNKLSIRFIENLERKFGIILRKKQTFDDSIILDDRNKKVIEEIKRSSSDKIYIQYSEAHFKGIYKLLKKEDPNWKISSFKKKKVL